MERVAGWVRTVVALIGGVALTFGLLFGLEMLGVSPSDVWNLLTGLFK